MLNLTNADKTQLSEPVLAFLNVFETRHVKKDFTLNVKAVQSTNREEFWQLRFYDPRFTEDEVSPVGVVEYTYGSRSEKEYKISSRKIQNDRYGHWGNENKSRRTKDAKKAASIALESLELFQWHEICAKPRREAEQKHEGWMRESQTYGSALGSIGIKEMVEELENLLNQNVTFKTAAFDKAISKLPEYYEHQRRAVIKPRFDTILDRGDKIVYIPDGRALEAQELPSIDVLSDSIKQGVALLKIMGGGNLIPEVGYKGGENTYFIYASAIDGQ